VVRCRYCGSPDGQVRAGISQGLQRYKCTACRRRYIPDRRERGYPSLTRDLAVQLHQQGMNQAQIAAHLQVSPPTVRNWLRANGGAPEGAPPDMVSLTPSGTDSIVPPAETTVEPLVAARERVTIRDVARLAGVSTTTISNYLNHKGGMGDETKAAIANVIEQLNFSPSALTRAIRQRKTRILGVVVFGIYDLDEHFGESITPRLLAGINRAADRSEYDILLYTGWPYRAKRASGLDFLNGHADGLIWVAPEPSEPALLRVAAAGLPIVGALTRCMPDAAGWVGIDNFAAISALVRHLVDLGHRRIAFAGPIYAADFQERRLAYREALVAHGLAQDPALEVTSTQVPWDEASYLPALQRWIDGRDAPTAILTSSDAFAGMLIGMIERLGRRVPDDFSVCGFDDIPDARQIGGGLTTIQQPFRTIGERAVERLVALIDGTPAAECRETVPGSLVVRTSTSPPRTTS